MNYRPSSFKELVGNNRMLERVKEEVRVSRKLNKAFAHSLFYGPPGSGKTTYARVLANELGVKMYVLSTTHAKKIGLYGQLKKLRKFDILFIDEIHRLPVDIAEDLYTAMEDFMLPTETLKVVNLPPFTLLGATTERNLIPPLYDRFINKWLIKTYSSKEIAQIVHFLSEKRKESLTNSEIQEIVENSKGSPRQASNLTNQVIDYKKAGSSFSVEKIIRGSVEYKGLDSSQIEYLNVISESTIGGGRLSRESLASLLDTNEDTISKRVEPELLRRGFIRKDRYGRFITREGVLFINGYHQDIDKHQEEG